MIRNEGVKTKLICLSLTIAFLTLITACSSKTYNTSTLTTAQTQITPTIVITPIPEDKLFKVLNISTTLDTEENKILSLILKASDDSSEGYAVISPDAGLYEGIINNKDDYINYFKDQGYEFSGLMNQLIEKNHNDPRLTIKSSREQGYYIDYYHIFYVFFTYVPYGDGWKKLHEFYPGAHGMVNISIPAYDPVTGYVLVYLGWSGDYLMGQGQLIAYLYKDGKLNEITRIGLWVS